MCYEEDVKAKAVRSQNEETPWSGKNRLKQSKRKTMENAERGLLTGKTTSMWSFP